MQAIKKSFLKITRKTVFLAIAISLLVTLTNYIVGNTSIPLPNELSILKGWDQMKRFNGWNYDSIPNEVLLVDVAYDKQLVDYYDEGFPVGQYAITDRQKLLYFLMAAKQADNYKYIMLDIFFEKGIKSPQDSALFNLIVSMDRIVIPSHKDTPLQDCRLYRKSANADYTVTWEETNFARYQFIHDNQASIPLRMYEDLDKRQIKKWWFLYFDNNWLCRNGITLKMPIRLTGEQSEGETMQKYNRYYLGADLISMDSITHIRDEIKDKIIVIGSFKDDVHETYLGVQPGSVICLNAYYALLRGDHIILGQYGSAFFFYLFMCAFYFALAIVILKGFTLSSTTKKIWLKITCSFISISVLFWIVAVLAYIALDVNYNLWVPLGIFSLFDYIINIHKHYKKAKI